MKKLFVILALMGFFLAFTSCEKDEPINSHEEELYYRPWQEYPNSYIKMCDYRMTFRFTDCTRVDGGLTIGFVLTNTGFNEKAQVSFYMPESAAHDDLGNTYKCAISGAQNQVVTYIDGEKVGVYGHGQEVTFMPNQAIKGSFMIKGFDINASAVSLSMNCRLVYPKGTEFMYNHIEFVNLPILNDLNDNPNM